MLKAFDNYLHRKSIDVTRIVGATSIVGALQNIQGSVENYVIDAPFHLNYLSFLSILVGIGLWQRREWARKVSLAGLYLTFLVSGWLIYQRYQGAGYAVSAQGARIAAPALAQFALALALKMPLLLLVLFLLHGRKARSECRPAAASSQPAT